MTDLDDKIRDALRREDKDLFDQLGTGPTLSEMLRDVFRGRMRFFVWVTMIYSLVFFVLAIICAVQFFQADDLRAQICWGVGFGMSMMFVLGLKIWWWMEMSKSAVLRELKRMELHLTRLIAEAGE